VHPRVSAGLQDGLDGEAVELEEFSSEPIEGTYLICGHSLREKPQGARSATWHPLSRTPWRLTPVLQQRRMNILTMRDLLSASPQSELPTAPKSSDRLAARFPRSMDRGLIEAGPKYRSLHTISAAHALRPH